MEQCNFCGNMVDERTISAHGYCIPCMDRLLDASDEWTAPFDELIRKMPEYTREIEQLGAQQKAIRSLFREVRAALKGQKLAQPGTSGYLHTCKYCGNRYRALKQHQRRCPKAPQVDA